MSSNLAHFFTVAKITFNAKKIHVFYFYFIYLFIGPCSAIPQYNQEQWTVLWITPIEQ